MRKVPEEGPEFFVEKLEVLEGKISRCLREFPALSSGMVQQKMGQIFELTAEINSVSRTHQAILMLENRKNRGRLAGFYDPDLMLRKWQLDQELIRDTDYRLREERITDLKTCIAMLDQWKWDLKQMTTTITSLMVREG